MPTFPNELKSICDQFLILLSHSFMHLFIYFWMDLRCLYQRNSQLMGHTKNGKNLPSATTFLCHRKMRRRRRYLPRQFFDEKRQFPLIIKITFIPTRLRILVAALLFSIIASSAAGTFAFSTPNSSYREWTVEFDVDEGLIFRNWLILHL